MFNGFAPGLFFTMTPLTIFFCVVLIFTTPVLIFVPSVCWLNPAGTSSCADVSTSSCFSWALRRARCACFCSKSSISWSMSCRRARVALARLLANDSAVSSFHLSACELFATEDDSVEARICTHTFGGSRVGFSVRQRGGKN
uniref:Uncharacterized protein n=1 Tax=Anopheles atroparvus TaxID=41427 RepID=A0A182IR85_ANOAO